MPPSPALPKRCNWLWATAIYKKIVSPWQVCRSKRAYRGETRISASGVVQSQPGASLVSKPKRPLWLEKRGTMKQLVTVFTFLLLAPVLSIAQDTAVEQEIKRLLVAQDEATVKGDVAALRKLSTEDFTLATPIGSIVTKEAFLQSVESRRTVYEEHRTEDITLRVFGDTAVARAVLNLKPVFNGQSRAVQMRATMVFVKVKGQWLLYTLHTSTIPPPRSPQPATPPATPKPPSE